MKLLRVKITKRQQAIAKQLPDAIDIIALQIEAGLGIGAACQKVTELLRGPLPDEFTRVLQKANLDYPIQEGLSDMGNLIESPGVWELLDALNQKTPPGASLVQVLRLQAEKLRGEGTLQGADQQKKPR